MRRGLARESGVKVKVNGKNERMCALCGKLIPNTNAAEDAHLYGEHHQKLEGERLGESSDASATGHGGRGVSAQDVELKHEL